MHCGRSYIARLIVILIFKPAGKSGPGFGLMYCRPSIEPGPRPAPALIKASLVSKKKVCHRVRHNPKQINLAPLAGHAPAQNPSGKFYGARGIRPILMTQDSCWTLVGCSAIISDLSIRLRKYSSATSSTGNKSWSRKVWLWPSEAFVKPSVDMKSFVVYCSFYTVQFTSTAARKFFKHRKKVLSLWNVFYWNIFVVLKSESDWTSLH